MDSEFRYIDISTTNLAGIQDVFKNVIKVETNYVPFSNFIRVIYCHIPNSESKEYRIMNVRTGDVIESIFRHKDEKKPFFIYVPFKGKEYIVTSTFPGAFSIVSCADSKTYDRTLEIDGKKAIPIKASAHIKSNDKNEDKYVDITFLCKFDSKDGEAEYKNITIKLSNMCTCELFSNMIVENAELSEEDQINGWI